MVKNSDNLAKNRSATRAVPDYADDVHSREHPPFFDLLRPGFVFTWMISFFEGWLVSRSYSRLVAAFPFLLIAVAGSCFVWWLRSTPQDDVVKHYETAIAAAIKSDDPKKTGLYLRGLTALRPHDHRYRFQLAVHQLEQGDNARAVSNLIALTRGTGYMPARLWLVTQAVSPDPKLPLEDEVLEQQLRAILSLDPASLSANQILADLHLRNGDFQAAEDRLRKVVNDVPALGLPLAKIERRLKRNEQQITRHLLQAEESFKERLVQNPDDEKARINRSEALMLRNEFADAERLLQEGLKRKDSPELRTALAVFYANAAQRRLAESFLNRDLSRKLFDQAIRLDPGNRSILLKMLNSAGRGATASPQILAPTIQLLNDEASGDPGDRVLLARILAMVGEEQQAINIVRPLADQNHKLRPLLVRLLYADGQKVEAASLVDTLREQLPDVAAGMSPAKAVEHAEILNLVGRFSETIALLEANEPPMIAESSQDEDVVLYQKWNLFYGRACLALFDNRSAAKSFESEGAAFKLLDNALKTKTVSAAVLERLVRLSCTEHEYAAAADKRLTKIRASGSANPLLYNLLGTQALQLNQPAKARQDLERAYSLGRDNPMVLNNLAIALVRDAKADGDAVRALQLANDALKILPEHPDVLSTRAEVLMFLNRWEEARRDLEVSLPQRPQSRNSRTLIAKVYDELGESELAAEHRRILKQTAVESPSVSPNSSSPTVP